MMKILALDLGTKTGYAHNLHGEIMAGTWLLATPKEVKEWGQNRMRRRCDPRVLRLANNISCKVDLDKAPSHLIPEIVVFEDVQFSSTDYQAKLWASLRAAVWLTCGKKDIILECVPTGVLKRFATGHGGATKEMMHAAVMGQPAKFITMDDNAVDAYWVLRWAETYLNRMKA